MPLLLGATSLLAAVLTPAPQTAPAARQAIGAALGALLQADGERARRALASIPLSALDARDAASRACILARLDQAPASPAIDSPRTGRPDAFARAVLTAYRGYWRDSVRNPATRDARKDRLRQWLARRLGRPAGTPIDEVAPLLVTRLERAGFHAIDGQTGLLQDLILWRKQAVRTETVALPEGSTATRVFYLDDFASRGWSTYLSCDRSGTGGWTKPDGLFVIVPAYASLTDETFRVNFLAHESQHFADNRRFPGLAGWELEYRAKLVELVYAAATRELVLARFADNQGDDPAEAHSYANRRVLAELRIRLGLVAGADLAAVPRAALQQAALAALLEDSARRTAKSNG